MTGLVAAGANALGQVIFDGKTFQTMEWGKVPTSGVAGFLAGLIPGTGFASVDGTYTNTERRLLGVEAAIDEGIELSNWEIASEIAYVYEEEFGWEDVYDISAEMDDMEPLYKYAEVGEVLDDVLAPEFAQFVVVGDDKFVEPHKCTDNLMNTIAERIPTPACMTK